MCVIGEGGYWSGVVSYDDLCFNFLLEWMNVGLFGIGNVLFDYLYIS